MQSNNRNRLINRLVLLVSILLAVWAPAGGAMGVQPMVLDFWGQPGEQYRFEILLLPDANHKMVNLSLFQPIQDLDGSVTFLEGDPSAYPPIGWIKLEQEQVSVPPGDPTRVTGTISIPFGAGGSYSVIIMVEPVVPDVGEGVLVVVRYAIRVTVNVDRPGLRSNLKILGMELLTDEEGRPQLAVRVQNPSPFRFPIVGESTIRDENRRLVDRVMLRTLSAWESGHDSFAIYPETELLLLAPIKAPLYGGKYYLQNFLSYDNNKQLIKGQELLVEEGQFPGVPDHFVQVQLDKIESQLQPGAAATHILQLESRHAKPVQLLIQAEDVVTDYPRSVFEHLEVEYRGDDELSLEAKERARGIFLIRAPRTAQPGGYYGNIIIDVLSAENDYLETHTIPVGIIVGKDWGRAAAIKNVAVEKSEEELLFSAALTNTGDAHFLPHGVLEIRNDEQNVIRVIGLSMPEGQESLLPQMTGFLTGSVERDQVQPGTYLATVLVFEGEQRVGIAEYPLVIEK